MFLGSVDRTDGVWIDSRLPVGGNCFENAAGNAAGARDAPAPALARAPPSPPPVSAPFSFCVSMRFIINAMS